jgi:eukaryotic-like serine/threonine-protein kinase
MIGQLISHYRILSKLGEGGMGVVYKAHDTKLDRDVALKFLPHYLTSDPNEKERFYHEAKAAAALIHQNIAVVHEIGEHEGQLFIAMEYVEGKTLKEFVGTIHESPQPLKKILDIAIQVCEGLAAAHEKGIVHRDIKSENIILTTKVQPKIMDFGLAKVKGATKLTKAGSTLGTAAYMSPEQARGEDVDQRSDIFSIGVVLYEMLTTHLPFRGEHIAAIQYSILNEDPPPLARYSEKITEELQHIVSKSLEKDPEDRYQHVDDMLADLRRERKHLEYARTGYATTIAKPAVEVIPKEEVTGKVLKGKNLIKVFAVIGVLAVLVVAFFLLKPILLEEAISSEQRTIAVISFINQTGDNSYDYLQDAIPNLLITNLEQSKYLRVATWERLYDLRKQIGKADTKIIDRETGFELCKMDGIDAIVLGSFTKAGDVFATDVKVLDVNTKQLLKSVNSKGDGVGSILKTQIDELSKEVSRGVGLSERKIQATPMQIMEVTTSSMEAYNFFLRGRDDHLKFYFDEARRYLERAISIDSTFAMAYVFLAFTCDKLNEYNASMMAYQKAAQYYQKTPDRERLMVEAALAANVEKNLDKALNLLKEVTRKYPKYKGAHYYLGAAYMRQNMASEAIDQLTNALQLDPEFGAALNELGYAYAKIGEYDKAIDCFKRYADVNPGDPNPFDSMAELYFKMGRLDDAIAKYNEVLDIKSDFGSTDLCLAYIYMLKEDFDVSLECADRYIAGHSAPGLKAAGYWIRALLNYYAKGKLNQSMKDIDKSQELFRLVGDERWIVLGDLLRGGIQLDRHEIAASRKLLDNFFSFELKNNPLGSGRADWAFASGMLALSEGQIPEARSELKELDSLLLEISPRYITKILRNQREVLYAELLIAEDSVDEAVHVIEKAGPPELPNFGEESMFSYNAPSSRDVAARAYIKKGAFDKAIDEYEKIIKFDPNSKDRRFILPKYHYALAKLYEKQGLREKAKAEYNRLMVLWKDADPDLPEFKDAKARLKGLKEKGVK